METTTNIEQLIPHRYPFLFVDEIVSAKDNQIVGTVVFDSENLLLKWTFPGKGVVPNTILLESMAQCGGAGVRLLGVNKGIFALVHIEQSAFFDVVKYNDEVRHEVTNIRMSEKIIKQTGKAYVGDALIMEATWMSIRID
ncbi:3-hydroxyacyl-ACP dehydratase FabZ family protein [Flavobacterium sp. C4GT6]|uniref:3-hydroxyacyl-ACP dehydratase FabZ family protein n=1 Tax=Flavobacterium sp. C4GT6 TaxID=3103818 RepID=UPI002ED21D70